MSPILVDSQKRVGSKGGFSVMLDEIQAVREQVLGNLKIAMSIEEALIGPCPSKEESQKNADVPGQIYAACSRLKEINGLLVELHDILTHIKKEAIT